MDPERCGSLYLLVSCDISHCSVHPSIEVTDIRVRGNTEDSHVSDEPLLANDAPG
jgi:hypothetical protein